MAIPTLKARIDKLINDLGGNPKPGPVDIRNRLTTFSALAEALESGQSSIEAEQKIVVMEATIKELEAKLQSATAEGKKLQLALDATRDEIQRVQNAEAENEPVSDVEARVLFFMDGKGLVDVFQLIEWFQGQGERALGILAGLTEAKLLSYGRDQKTIILTRKGKAWLVRHRHEKALQQPQGSAESDSLKAEISRLNSDFLRATALLAEKSDEVEELKRVINPPRRPEIEEEILLLLKPAGADIMPQLNAWRVGYFFDIGEDMARVYLVRLRKAGYVVSAETPESGEAWNRTEAASEYLAIHGLLQKQHEEREQRRLHRLEDERKAKSETPAIGEEVLSAIAALGPMSCDKLFNDCDMSIDRAEVALHDLAKAGLLEAIKPATKNPDGSINEEAVYDFTIEGKRYALSRGYLH